MTMANFFYTTEHPITKEIIIHVPTVGEILNGYGEDEYYALLSYFLATSYDLILELEDMGIDYTTISDFEIFCMRFQDFQTKDTSILFSDLDFTKFNFAVNNETGGTVLWDGGNIIIDDAVFWKISQFLRRLTHTKRNYETMGNKEAKRYTLEKLRRHRNRQRSKPPSTYSTMEQSIIALVNTAEFKYDYQSVLDLTLLQFNASLLQVQKKVNCDYMMTGVFMGTVDWKPSDPRFNWMLQDNP